METFKRDIKKQENGSEQSKQNGNENGILTKLASLFVISLGVILFLLGVVLAQHQQEALSEIFKIVGAAFALDSVVQIITQKGVVEFTARRFEIILNAVISREAQKLIPYFNALFADFKESLSKQLAQNISNIQKIQETGLVNVHEDFDLKKILLNTKPLENKNIYFVRGAFTDAEFEVFKVYLGKSLAEKTWSFNILLLDPASLTVKETNFYRAEEPSENQESLTEIRNKLKRQIAFFQKLHLNLPTELKENLQLRFCAKFPPASVTAFGDSLFYCNYLGCLEIQNGQYHELKDDRKAEFKKWHNYVMKEWQNAKMAIKKGDSRIKNTFKKIGKRQHRKY